jgi:hypothetical protein
VVKICRARQETSLACSYFSHETTCAGPWTLVWRHAKVVGILKSLVRA